MITVILFTFLFLALTTYYFHSTKHKKIFYGEILVSGTDTIELCMHHRPKKVKVWFKKTSINVPCNNAKECDLVYWTVNHRDDKYYVEINWEVFDKATLEYKIVC